ncbi:GNAT family N-acetyltransferase [Clostridium sp. D2Q-14]|uniref:GNAT family N-acetyltransferase n=1 Tax=Anaeromonas gelatinilytica TaxID=2683194 RepID=UPI00193B63F2|nr:GNAT family N-acetyltransferase [Anaeromonas gelatinilytica]MBS4535653.1 GNAT family N-acetyltransferase [Anaeromonas gelatinilytica]
MNELNYIWDIYNSSFPEDEKRSIELQKKILKDSRYSFRPLKDKDEIVGFIAIWDLDDFIFIDHYAIDKKYRGKGYGKRFLKELLNEFNKMIVLEVEKPENDIAKRRIKFYEELNFYLNNFSYKQPAYEKNKKSVTLLVMTYPKSVDKDTFNKIKNKLYNDVYEFL